MWNPQRLITLAAIFARLPAANWKSVDEWLEHVARCVDVGSQSTTEGRSVSLPILVQEDECKCFALAGPPGLAVFLITFTLIGESY